MERTLQLLICEDVEADAALIIRSLEKGGYVINSKRVETADEMRTALKKERWDVVISDYNIPGFGGPQALSVLRSSDVDIPFILVSGTIGEEIAVSIMKAGASDYLMKDRLVRLSEVVKREMEEAERRREWKSSAEMIQANEEKYHAVIDNSLFAIFLARPGGLILEANKAAGELFGYTIEEFTRMGRNDLLDIKEESNVDIINMRDLYGKGYGEFMGIKKNGNRFYCEVSSVIFKDINGQDMACAMIADISPRKEAELKLLNSNIELQKLSTHLKNAREDERKYISREIHDQLGQLASALKIELDWLNLNVKGLDEKANSRIYHALSITKTMITTTRKIATALRPSIIDELGLNDSLKWQCAEFQNLNGIECTFEEDFDDNGVSLGVRTELFRICQESLTNVMRHAHASTVAVTVRTVDDALELCIRDNGRGFDTNKKSSHIGLVGVRERALSVGGDLEIESTPGKGTNVCLLLPRSKLYI